MATGTLTSTTIAARYKSLLKLTGTANDVLAADASAKYVEDGDGNDSVLSLSTTRVGLGNTAPASVFHLTGTMQVGVDDAGHDVIFYGNAASSNMTWDTSEDDLVLNDSRLFIDQDDNVSSIYIDSEATTTHLLYVDTPTNTSGHCILVNAANSLTTGSCMNLNSSSTDTSSRNLLEIGNNHASATGAVNLFLDQNANNEALFIDAENTTIGAVDIHCDTLTSGRIARFYSDSSDTTARELVSIHNDHASAVGATCLKILQDSTGKAISATGGIVEEGGVLKENLLTNSGFDVWSNSTLLEATGGAAPVTSGANSALTNNLLTNGGFDSGTSSWTAITATLSNVGSGQTGNMLRVTSDSGQLGYAYQDITTVIGKLYLITYYIDVGTSSTAAVWVGTTGDSDSILGNTDTDTTSGTLHNAQHVFEATATTTRITLVSRDSSSTDYSEFDTVAVYEVTPGCVAANVLALDGWSKRSALSKIYRQHNDGGTNTKDGSFYSLKVVSTVTAWNVAWPIQALHTLGEHLQRFNGRTVTFGAWVKTGTGSAARLGIYDGTNYYSSYHTGGGAWEWLEMTQLIGASSTNVQFSFEFNASATAYWSQPMLVYGSSIGEGNYTRPQGEIIYLETTSHRKLTSFDNVTISSDTATVNLEAESEGRIPKGAKAVQIRFAGKSTTVEAVMLIDNGDTKNNLHVYSQVSGSYVSGSAVVACDINGDIGIERSDTWTNCYIYYDAVHLR
jgi:hypothetical protein